VFVDINFVLINNVKLTKGTCAHLRLKIYFILRIIISSIRIISEYFNSNRFCIISMGKTIYINDSNSQNRFIAFNRRRPSVIICSSSKRHSLSVGGEGNHVITIKRGKDIIAEKRFATD